MGYALNAVLPRTKMWCEAMVPHAVAISLILDLGEQGVVPPRSWSVHHFYNPELEEYTATQTPQRYQTSVAERR